MPVLPFSRGLPIAGAMAIAAVACSWESRPTAPRLVLLYATCTVNKSFLSPYNPDVRYTPHLEAIRGDSVVFMRHQTEAGQSSVAFASLFSGTQSDRHGIFTAPQRLSDDVTLLAEVFRDAGYDSYAWLNHNMASKELNYAQGVARSNASDAILTAEDRTFREILERLRVHRDYKALLVTNFTVTHGPYRGRVVERFCELHPSECGPLDDPRSFERYRQLYFRNRRSLSFDFDATVKRLELSESEVRELANVLELLYKADVFYLDALFGGVLDRIRDAELVDDTLVAFTADHGEVLFRENAVFQWSHSLQLAPEVLNVPFILYAPGTGIRPGSYDAVTRSIDVLPTLAGLAGVPLDAADVAGTDLSPALRGDAPPSTLLAFSHTAVLSPRIVEASMDWPRFRRMHPRIDPELMWVALRSGDMLYKEENPDGRGFRVTAHDLRADPEETEDVFDPTDAAHRTMRTALASYKAALVEAYGAGDFPDRELPLERQIELLRSLGYID